jgi:hypothetical protein
LSILLPASINRTPSFHPCFAFYYPFYSGLSFLAKQLWGKCIFSIKKCVKYYCCVKLTNKQQPWLMRCQNMLDNTSFPCHLPFHGGIKCVSVHLALHTCENILSAAAHVLILKCSSETLSVDMCLVGHSDNTSFSSPLQNKYNYILTFLQHYYNCICHCLFSWSMLMIIWHNIVYSLLTENLYCLLHMA